ncbi:MAG: serine/threonine-protein kinase, partial [Acidimicrobiales bacterium]
MSGSAAETTDMGRIADAIPDYDVQRELGRGGMGIVYLGRHRRLDRGVAIKELPPSFAAEPEVRERFSTEARTLAGLSHPHIVPIFDYVEREGLCLIVMEQLPGGTVWDRFTSSGLTPPTACAVVMACCAALQHAHSKGVLHLDVKPDNLMFDAESAVKVTDFGIARVISGDRTMGTVDGQVLGTPAYMSPEQARGEDLTPASDVYAAGVMLYELLSGQLPWQGAETASELLSQRLREDPIPLRDVAPHVPQPLADVVMTSLSRDVTTRYQRAEDLGVAIGEACADSWGPGWLDHSGVAIVGSERLSRAARTTGHHTGAAAAATGTAPAPVITGTGAASETVARGGAQIPGASDTTVTGKAEGAIPGAAETGVVGAPAAAPEGAHETMARPTGTPAAAPATGAVPAA